MLFVSSNSFPTFRARADLRFRSPSPVDLSSSPQSICNLKPSLLLGGRRLRTISVTSFHEVSGFAAHGKDPFDLVSFIDQVSFSRIRLFALSLSLGLIRFLLDVHRLLSQSDSTLLSSSFSSSSSNSVGSRRALFRRVLLRVELTSSSASSQVSDKSSSSTKRDTTKDSSPSRSGFRSWRNWRRRTVTSERVASRRR